MRFFNSKNVKIFPCSNRGTYSSTVEYEASETLDSVFDLESRLASEYNFTNLSGIINNKKSYVISFEQLPYPITRSQDPAHSHSFNEKGVCSCGVLSSGHTHQFNANNICLGCGWEPDYLLKVVINGYYFEIITKKFPIFTVSSGTSLINDYKSILDSKLWITLQKTSLREADLHDNARHTYQLGSMFARSYTGTHEAEKAKDEQTVANSSNYYLSQHFEILEPGSQQLAIPVSTIINGSIALNILDFPADHVAGSIAKEYYCSAIGITSNGNSLEPWVGEGEEAPDGHFKVLLERESGETEADVVLCCLDLSDPANWLENLAAGKFLNSPDFSNRVEGPEELDVEKLFVTSISPTQTKGETGPVSGSLDIQATTITSNSVDATSIMADALKAETIEAETIEVTATVSAPKADLDEISTDKASISALIVPSLECITLDKGTESTADDKTLKAEIDDLIDEADVSVKNELRGDLVLRAADTETGISEIKLRSDIDFTKLYGTTPCIAESKPNWDSENSDAWKSDIPTGLTLTGLRREISCLTQQGGEPNKLNYLYVGDTKLVTTSKGDDTLVVDLDQKLAIANLSDASRVTNLETLVGTSEFYADTTIVEDIADLKVQLKNLDNVMNFVGVINPTQFKNYTKSTTYTDRDGRTIEVGDVVVVTLTGGFNYLGNRYVDGTEFICTGVLDEAETVEWQEGEKTESLARLSIWQEIGTCNITDSTLKELIGEDIDGTRGGSIKVRLCNVEDSISDMQDDLQDDTTEGTISYRIKTIEDTLGDDTDEESIQGRLSALETLTGADGAIISAITANTEAVTTNTEAIGDSDTDGTIINRLDTIETAIGSSGTTDSILDRLATIEGILDGTGDAGDSDEGEVDSSITGRLTAVDTRLTTVETNIGDVAISSVVERISTLEDNEIVKAAANLTLEDFKTSIEDTVKAAVISDEDFIDTVEGFIGTTVNGQTSGKVIDFIDSFADTDDFKNKVKAEIETFATTPEFTDVVDSKITPYITSDPFKAKVDTEISSNYVLDSPTALAAIRAKASEVAQQYTLSEDDVTKINEKASGVAQSYNLDDLDKDEVGEKVATYISKNYSLTLDDKAKIGGKVGTYILEDYTFSEAEQGNIELKTTEAFRLAIINHTIAEDNTQISDTVTDAYDRKIGQYTIADNDATIADKVNSAFYSAIQNMKIVALAFNSNEVPVDPALIQPVVAVSGSYITLPTLTSNGKTFRGWHPNKDSTEAAKVEYAPQENTLYYAIWEDTPETED